MRFALALSHELGNLGEAGSFVCCHVPFAPFMGITHMARRVSGLALAGALGVLIASAGLVGPASAQAKGKSGGTCVNKAASGTNTTKDGAMFQAWEAVLQATDWGSWATFMGSGAKVGTAPGYRVSNVKSKCGKGGIGFSCKMQATLCK